MLELAQLVQRVAREGGCELEIARYTNPRIEDEDHYYAVNTKLLDLGSSRTTSATSSRCRCSRSSAATATD